MVLTVVWCGGGTSSDRGCGVVDVCDGVVVGMVGMS